MSSGLFNSKPLHISQADSFEISIEKFLDGFGFRENKEWTFIGSFGKKEFSGDVDIAILGTDLEFWERNLEKWEYPFKVVKGFNQISFGYPFEGQIVQVDLMLTRSLEWSKFIYYSPNLSAGESEFKGIYRNLLLSSLVITTSRLELNNGDIEQFILRLNEGLIRVVKSFKDENGKVSKNSKIISEQFTTNDPSYLRFIFTLEPIDTFEQLWNQIKARPKVEEIKERFEKFCKQSKINIPDYGE